MPTTILAENYRLTVEGPGGTSTAVKGDAVGVQKDGLNFPVIGGDPVVDDDLAIDTSSELPEVEFGEVVVNAKRQRIYFEEPFADPILVVTRVGTGMPRPYDNAIRVDSVDSAGFDIRLRESSHPKRLHRSETIRYLAIERGLHQLPGGARIEADQVDIGTWARSTDVRFGGSFSNTPVVLTTLVEDIEIGAMAMRSGEVSTLGFDVILDARKSRRSRPAYQTLNYIAWEPSVVDANEMSIIAAYTCDAVAGDASRIELETTFSESPLLMTTTPRKRGKSRLAAELCLDLTEPRDQTAVDMQEVLVGQVAIGEPLRVDGEALCLKVGSFGDRGGERTSDGKVKAGRFSSSP